MKVIKFNEDWVKIFWNLSKGDKSSMDALRKTNYIEFWYILDEFEAEIERLKAKSKK